MLSFDILIIGAGAAGLSAAAAACGAGCESVLVADSRPYPGGILPQCIHDGFSGGLTGPEYAGKLEKAFRKSGAELMLETTVLSVKADRTAVLSCRNCLITVSFRAVIFASGCREIPLGALKIAGTRPEGIYNAGQAQELINLQHRDLGDNVLIIGSGDLGMIMARRFTLCGKRVTALVEREKSYGGMARNYHACIEKYNIPIIYNCTAAEVYGDKRVSAVRLSDGRIIQCETLVIAAGLTPERELAAGLEETPWVYFCGNCSRVHSMVESAAAEGEETGKKAAAGLML